jgi:beta-N-acetylhexosaminidase
MLSKTPSLYDPIWTNLVSAMKTEAEFRERVRDAARRTLAVKLEYLRAPGAVPPVPDPERVARELPDPEGRRFFLDLAARSVTVVRGEGKEAPFPLSPESAGRVLLAGQYGDFFSCGLLAFPGAERFRFQGAAGRWELAQRARNADTVIFCLAGAEDLPVLNELRASGKRIIVFSILSPVYLEQVPWIDGAVAVYSYARESFVAGFSAIVGRIPADGVLPFNIGTTLNP